MYTAEVFNSRGLFQRLGGWMPSLSGTGAERRALVVLQRAYQVLFHLEQADHLELVARQQFNAHVRSMGSVPETLRGWSPTVVGLIIEITGALTALRVLQNDVWVLVTNANGARNAPSSMRDASKKLGPKLDKGKKRPGWYGAIPIEVRAAVSSYWQQSGETAALYRDIEQHHDVLARGCFLLTDGETITRVSVRLPDNPATKAPKEFVFNDEIDGLELAHRSFEALHGLVEDVAQAGGATPAPLKRSTEFVPPIEHSPGVRQPTALVLFDHAGETGLLIGQDEETHATFINSSAVVSDR